MSVSVQKTDDDDFFSFFSHLNRHFQIFVQNFFSFANGDHKRDP